MIFKFLVVLTTFFVFQNSISANEPEPSPSPFCIANKAEYLAKKSQLPEVLQDIETKPNGKMYRLRGIKRMAAKAAMKLRIADNNKFIFDAGVAAPGKLFFIEENYISEICFEKDQVKIILENDTFYTASIKNSSSFELEGGTFEPTTEANFAQELESVKSKLNSINTNSKSGTR